MRGRSSFFSRSGHLDAATCDAPLTWVGSSVSSMELKLTASSVVVDILLIIVMNEQKKFLLYI